MGAGSTGGAGPDREGSGEGKGGPNVKGWKRIVWRGLLALLVPVVVVAEVRAETHEYVLDVPEGQPVTFILEFKPRFAGVLGIEADWEGSRQLSFRVDGPGEQTVKGRRVGLSPQHFEIALEESLVGRDQVWSLTIRALPARGDARGKVRIVLPEAAPLEPAREEFPVPPPPPAEAWMLRSDPPQGASSSVVALFATVEELRSWTIPEDGLRRDACGWQADLLRYLAGNRDEAAGDGLILEESTWRFLVRASGAIHAIEDLRTTSDPILSGPVPTDAKQRRAWLRLRRERIHPLESELDYLGEALRRGYAPELDSEIWLQRFVGCLIACERYFEQRTRLGAEKASNQELARDQWEGFLAAARAFAALVTAASGRDSRAALVSPVRPEGR